jgi:hypothetical protein
VEGGEEAGRGRRERTGGPGRCGGGNEGSPGAVGLVESGGGGVVRPMVVQSAAANQGYSSLSGYYPHSGRKSSR